MRARYTTLIILIGLLLPVLTFAAAGPAGAYRRSEVRNASSMAPPSRTSPIQALRSGADGLVASAEELEQSLGRRPDFYTNFTFFLNHKDTIIASNILRESAEDSLAQGLLLLEKQTPSMAEHPVLRQVRQLLAQQKETSARLKVKRGRMDLGGVIAELGFRAGLMRRTAAEVKRLVAELARASG
ncbi:MAG: hypothetical protein AAB229_06955 [Candidatus Hydrogenedentota bacterium]